MENQRDDLVVILAGYKDRMDTFFQSNPGMSSRIAHHIDFPDYTHDELLRIAELMLERLELPLRRRRARGAARVHRARACSSRTSPTRARCATRSTARGCARPTGCSTAPARTPTRDALQTLDRRRHPRIARAGRALKPHNHTTTRDTAMHLGRPTLPTFLARAARRRRPRTSARRAAGRRGRRRHRDRGDDHARRARRLPRRRTARSMRRASARQRLDVLAQRGDARRAASAAAAWRRWCRKKLEQPVPVREPAGGRYLLVFDPLDGSSNIDVNVSVGTHLLGAERPHVLAAATRPTSCSPGTRQVAAGYAIYGPSTMLVLTVGTRHARLHARPRARRVHAHAPRPAHPRRDAASSRSTPATRASGSRRCSATSANARPAPPARAARDFNMRWIACWSPKRTAS